MTDATQPTTAPSTAYVKLVRDDRPYTWRDATIEESFDQENIEVYRGKRKIASFSTREVSYWCVDEE